MRGVVFRTALLVVVLFGVGVAYGQDSAVYGGALQHGGTLVIRGTGFGAKPAADPLNLENFESDSANDEIDTTQARVEIGDNPVYEQCTHREIQPVESWSDTEISMTVNLGSFEPRDNIWIFVLNGSGQVVSIAEVYDPDGPQGTGQPVMGTPGQPTIEGRQ